jgi:hypothetical protein
MPEWIGTAVFLLAVGLTGAKINRDFGSRGGRALIVLLIVTATYAAAVGFAYM